MYTFYGLYITHEKKNYKRPTHKAYTPTYVYKEMSQ